MTEISFNADAEENQNTKTPFDPLPLGDYVVVVDKAENKPLKNKEGWRLACELTVIEGEYENRKLFHSFNLGYPIPGEAGEAQDKAKKTLQIARGQFGELVRGCGKVEISDTSEILNIAVVAKVKIRPANGQYEAQNEIKSFKSRDGAATTKTTADAVTKPKASAPWGKR